MRKRRFFVNRGDFGDAATYAAALRAAGGPELDQLDDLAGLPGEDGDLLRSIFGPSGRAFADAVRAERADQQRLRPHALVAKWSLARRRQRRRP